MQRNHGIDFMRFVFACCVVGSRALLSCRATWNTLLGDKEGGSTWMKTANALKL